ncbi:MAG: hypothetical protein HY744_27130 [Deltaproteobacteria bacterium]|nr:hypothetical protein [Deltaproteobacteria bacterium]
MKGLALRPHDRWPSAREMALALEQAVVPATAAQVGEWVERVAAKTLKERANKVADIESISSPDVLTAPDPAAVLGAAPNLSPEGQGGDSQVSSLSVATPAAASLLRTPAGRRLVAAVVAMAVVVCVLAVVLSLVGRGPAGGEQAVAASGAPVGASGQAPLTAPPAASPGWSVSGVQASAAAGASSAAAAGSASAAATASGARPDAGTKARPWAGRPSKSTSDFDDLTRH